MSTLTLISFPPKPVPYTFMETDSGLRRLFSDFDKSWSRAPELLRNGVVRGVSVFVGGISTCFSKIESQLDDSTSLLPDASAISVMRSASGLRRIVAENLPVYVFNLRCLLLSQRGKLFFTSPH